MGLDISVQTGNQEVLDADCQEEHYGLHSLSRTFCNFMLRQHNVVAGQPEPDQIGQLTGIDLAPLYEMETCPEAEWLESRLGRAESEEDWQKLLQEAALAKTLLAGNLGRVQATVAGLLSKLAWPPQITCRTCSRSPKTAHSATRGTSAIFTLTGALATSITLSGRTCEISNGFWIMPKTWQQHGFFRVRLRPTAWVERGGRLARNKIFQLASNLSGGRSVTELLRLFLLAV